MHRPSRRRIAAMRPSLRLVPIAFLLALSGGHTADAATAKNGLDAAARARLVGDHMLTLQWIGWGDLDGAGRVAVTDRGDTLALEGEQRGHGDSDGDYLRVSGRIVAATQDDFTFEGTILTRVSHIAGGRECKRDGTYHFQTKAGRKYWRMQEIDNPCDTAADYVDIYFRGI